DAAGSGSRAAAVEPLPLDPAGLIEVDVRVDRTREHEQAAGVDDDASRAVGCAMFHDLDDAFAGDDDVSGEQPFAHDHASTAHDERAQGPATPSSAVNAGQTTGSWPGTRRYPFSAAIALSRRMGSIVSSGAQFT
ncbi:MAG: hypothetical protein QOF97_2660, partial [Acidimicrobiaceae bacterium]